MAQKETPATAWKAYYDAYHCDANMRRESLITDGIYRKDLLDNYKEVCKRTREERRRFKKKWGLK